MSVLGVLLPIGYESVDQYPLQCAHITMESNQENLHYFSSAVVQHANMTFIIHLYFSYELLL